MSNSKNHTTHIMYRLISFLIIIFLFTTLFGKTPVYKSTYYSGPLEINAVLDEWPASLISDKSGFEYFVMNDSTHLYICILLRDQAIRRKVQSMGLTLWIDPMGKKKSRFGINFPMKRNNRPNAQSQAQNQLDSIGKRALNNFNNTFNNRMMLTGFTEKGEEEIMHSQFHDGIKVALLNNGYAGLFYELSIDLNLIVDNPNKYLGETENYLSLGFETGFIDPNTQRPNGTGMNGGGRGGRGGGSPGGGMPGGQKPTGGGQRGQGGDMTYMTQQTRLWLKSVQLASVDQ